MLKSLLFLPSIFNNQTNLQKRSIVRGMSNLQESMIGLPPRKVSFGKTKLLTVVGVGTALGAFTASRVVALLESFDVYPDSYEDDDY